MANAHNLEAVVRVGCTNAWGKLGHTDSQNICHVCASDGFIGLGCILDFVRGGCVRESKQMRAHQVEWYESRFCIFFVNN
jgi:hypothetical protein